MKILIWHVHGSWTTALVQGPHTYMLPLLPDRGPDGRGRAQTWEWPDAAVELTPAQIAAEKPDLVILQRPHEEELLERWTGLRTGCDVAAVYVEHNAPQGRIEAMRHPVAGRDDVTLVHVTHFNDLFWDAGSTATRVVEHGIVDPGYRYSGELAEAAVAINEPRRRWRVTGTDLLPRLNGTVPLRLFGIGAAELGGIENLRQDELHGEMARRRAYLHPIRWTSLGLSLIEAMQLGMPVVALATTEVVEAVPASAGVVSTRIETLSQGLRELIADPEQARERGRAARRAALQRYGLERFLGDWERLLGEVAR
jgi:glycosyltransferase involved in cell wall biosynthesis